jgi:hypothetical protein
VQCDQLSFFILTGWHHASSLREENGEKLAHNLLTEAYQQHEQGLLKQLLSANGLSLSWTDVILPLCHEIINVIRPGICPKVTKFRLKSVFKTRITTPRTWTSATTSNSRNCPVATAPTPH